MRGEDELRLSKFKDPTNEKNNLRPFVVNWSPYEQRVVITEEIHPKSGSTVREVIQQVTNRMTGKPTGAFLVEYIVQRLPDSDDFSAPKWQERLISPQPDALIFSSEGQKEMANIPALRFKPVSTS